MFEQVIISAFLFPVILSVQSAWSEDHEAAMSSVDVHTFLRAR
jgi:hypothetical protein